MIIMVLYRNTNMQGSKYFIYTCMRKPKVFFIVHG